MFDKIKSFASRAIDWVRGKKEEAMPILNALDQDQPERNLGGQNYLHISREATTLINLGGHTISIPAAKGVTYFAGKNAAKRYVERLASNNKEKRMLRSRLKRRQAELASQVAAA